MLRTSQRACHWRLHQSRYARGFQSSGLSRQQIQHTTYFQPPLEPPRPRQGRFRRIAWNTAYFTLGLACAWRISDSPPIDDLSSEEDYLTPENLDTFNGYSEAYDPDAPRRRHYNALKVDLAVRAAPTMLDDATEMLQSGSFFDAATKVLTHACQWSSNLPGEDAFAAGLFAPEPVPADHSKPLSPHVMNPEAPGLWSFWGIFDGHAGPQTSDFLKDTLPVQVYDHLIQNKFWSRPYTPGDSEIFSILREAFLELDRHILQRAEEVAKSDAPRAIKIAACAQAFAGSCALFSLFDPTNSILRVACVGDSRAVLGRWNEQSQSYQALPMSIDQTGFNPNEVARLEREHPGEIDIVDPRTGRVFGLAVSRAFGDARWKWPEEVNEYINHHLWGPKPRPKGLIRSPPYLTAEPEITEIKVDTDSQHPDFLIMASDGLWDHMSSENAVTCVQKWLDKYKPDAPWQQPGIKRSPPLDRVFAYDETSAEQRKHFVGDDPAEDEDLYLDEQDGYLRWRTSPKHFTAEDDNCGVHLIRNAFGGKRRNLFSSIMTVQPPFSRQVRDDITVQVVFFTPEKKQLVASN